VADRQYRAGKEAIMPGGGDRFLSTALLGLLLSARMLAVERDHAGQARPVIAPRESTHPPRLARRPIGRLGRRQLDGEALDRTGMNAMVNWVLRGA
jgi:hypothetical protein